MKTSSFRSIHLLVAALLVGAGLAPNIACAQAVANAETTTGARIVAGCKLALTVEEEEGLTGSYEVDADGNIVLTVDDGEGGDKRTWKVNLKGKTATQAGDAITESLKQYLKNPQVRVRIARMPEMKVEVVGPVKKPGSLSLARNARLSDALSASVYLPNADLANLRILRKERADPADPKSPPKVRTIACDFAAFVKGDSNDDPTLEAGDRIVIPLLPEIPQPVELKYVRIVGEVQHEAAIPLVTALTLSEVFDRAGGLKATADRESVLIVRAKDGAILKVNADKAEQKDPDQDVSIGAGDLIIVGKRDQSLIFSVSGEVARPSTFPFPTGQRLTVRQALEAVGGLTKKGDRKKGYLRKGYLRNPTLSHMVIFDLDQIDKGKQQDFEVEPGDEILILPKQKRPTFWQQALPLLFRFLPLGI